MDNQNEIIRMQYEQSFEPNYNEEKDYIDYDEYFATVADREYESEVNDDEYD